MNWLSADQSRWVMKLVCPYTHTSRHQQTDRQTDTLHKIIFRVPKITRTAKTLYKIKGVMWEYS